MVVKGIVLTGFGINCDYETQFALKMSGCEARRVHINDFIAGRESLEQANILVFPGGFSFGDDIASGKVLANKIKKNLGAQVQELVGKGGLVLGVCNGFQAMVKMGLLPDPKLFVQTTTLTFNDSGRFEDRWAYLKVEPTKCVFTKGLQNLYLPVRHGEGKFIAPEDVLIDLEEKKQVVLRYADKNFAPTEVYPKNPNGSLNNIAGICDQTGQVFGLMPHPECFVDKTQHPRWTREGFEESIMGKNVFFNAVKHFK